MVLRKLELEECHYNINMFPYTEEELIFINKRWGNMTFTLGLIIGIYIGYKFKDEIRNAIDNFNNWKKGN